MNWLNNVFNNIIVTGNVEFNDGFLSNGDGTFTTTPGLFIYAPGAPAAGNLIYTVAGDPGTDIFGNNYVGGGETSYDNVNAEALTNGGAVLQWYNMTSFNPGAGFTKAGSLFNASASGPPSILQLSDALNIDCTSGTAVLSANVPSGGGWALLVSNNGNLQTEQISPLSDGNIYYCGIFLHEVQGIVINNPAGSFTLIDTFSVVQNQRYELMVRMGYLGAQNAGAPIISFQHGGSVSLAAVTAHGYTQFGWVQNAIYNGVGLSDRTGPTLQNGGSQYYETYATFVAPGTGSVGISGAVSITGDNWTVGFCHTRLRPIS